MTNIIEDITSNFKNGNILTRLIYINAGLFLFLGLINVLLRIFDYSDIWAYYFKLPAFFPELLKQPWSIITYMFMHQDFIHLIFNLLALYWFGKIFISYFNQRQLLGLYILGGLGGAFSYIFAYNFIPYFEKDILVSYLVGASASVMAIIFALVRYIPNKEINLALIGPVKLKYLGISMLVLDIIGTTSTNAGGCIAHIGGASVGFLFSNLYISDRDITSYINRVINFINNFWNRQIKHKPKFTVYTNTNKSNKQWNMGNSKTKREDNDEINRILDKIKKTGYTNLSEEEKKRLFELSSKQTKL